MTIEKGVDWGRSVARPGDLRIVGGDAALAAALTDGSGRPTAVSDGDLHRTLGGRDVDGRDELLQLPIDLLRVTLGDGSGHVACAHVSLYRPSAAGGWWRGDVLMVMNAQFLGGWHVTTRGHPNDGRAESCGWDRRFGLRQRLEARRRLPTGEHVPHPLIETRSFRDREWEFAAPLDVVIDGRRTGRTTALRVEVDADAAVVYA